MPNTVWTWLGKENNRAILILLGGAAAAIATALWTLYTYEPPAKEPAVATEAAGKPTEPEQPGQTAIAENGGIAINADGNTNVTVHQAKP